MNKVIVWKGVKEVAAAVFEPMNMLDGLADFIDLTRAAEAALNALAIIFNSDYETLVIGFVKETVKRIQAQVNYCSQFSNARPTDIPAYCTQGRELLWILTVMIEFDPHSDGTMFPEELAEKAEKIFNDLDD